VTVGACSSGRTTGQLCRYRVVDPDATMTFGFNIARLAVLRSNQDATGDDDCLSFRGEVSGGAILPVHGLQAWICAGDGYRHR
jgi:hypothetical protein